MSGQSIMDRVTAAKHSIAGQGLAKTVCKATTEEVMGPKRKHLDYLLQCTNEPNVSIPQLADLLLERTQNGSWVIVFKALVTINNLMNYGNERFTQYLASNNCSFNLSGFIDKTGVQGYDMSTFIRRYAKYLNEKALTYRLMAFDFCKVKRGRDDGLLRTMNSEKDKEAEADMFLKNIEYEDITSEYVSTVWTKRGRVKLLKTLPILQKQIDALLEFDCTANELTNGVINACFMLLFKDLIRLFACYNDGIINLLEKYFDMNKKHCKEALDIYKRFLVRMDKVSEFLKVAENVGIDKGDIPDLAKAPASLLDALEQHLLSMEGKKGTGTVSPPKPSGFNSAINAIASNSSIQVSDEERKKILEEEGKQLQQLKVSLEDSHGDLPPGSTTQPASQSPAAPQPAPPAEVDLLSVANEPQDQRSKETGSAASPSQPPASSTNPFASPPPPASTAQTASPSKPSEDLLNLNENPFVQNVQNVMQMNQGANMFGAPAWGAPSAGGGFNENNFASFPNGTGGAPSTTGTDTGGGMFPLDPSPSKPPAVSDSFDPYDPLVGLATSEEGPKEGFGGGLFGAPPGGSDIGQQVMGRLSPSVPVVRSGSPAVDAFTGDAFTGDAFSSTAFSSETFSTEVFPGSDTFTVPESTEQTGGGFDAFGEILQPSGTPTKSAATQQKPAIGATKDLDSNLAMLAGNISINGANSVKKPQHQWQPKGDQKLTGGSTWAPPSLPQATTWSQPAYGQPMRQGMAGMGQQGMPMMNPGMGVAPQPGMGMGMMGTTGMGQPMGGMGMGPQPGMGMPMGQQPMFGAVRPGMQPMGMTQPQPPVSQANDPFGAL